MKQLLILLFLLSCVESFAQKKGQALIDSISAELPKLKDDSNKVKALYEIVKTEIFFNPSEGIAYAQKGLALAEKINWKKGMANLHNGLGLLIGDTGNNTEARKHFELSYTLNKELDAKFSVISNLSNIGRSYRRESDFTKAADYFFKALSIAEEVKNYEQIALVTSNISANYAAQQDYPKAIEYSEKSLKNAELAHAPRYIASELMSLGIYKKEANKIDEAKVYFSKAMKIYQELDNQPKIAEVLVNISGIESDYEHNYEKAIATILKAQAIYDVIGKSSYAATINIFNLGNVYYEYAMHTIAGPARKEYLKKAKTYLLEAKAFAEKNESAEAISHVCEVLADVETTNGNDKAALENYKRFTSINDSLYSQEKKNEIAGLEGKHNIAVKDNEIAINKLMLANQRKTQWGLMAGLGLLVIIGGLLYWQSRSRKKTNTTLMVLNNQLDEANKVKARFFSILSHDLRSPIVNLVHFLQLQKDSPDLLNEEQQTTHRQNISDSAEDLLNNMEAMLLWSKEQMENFRPNIKMVAVSDLFAYLQRFIGHTEKVNISFDAPAGLMVSTDENYLRTIMQNLTSNAMRALKNTPNASIEWKAKKEGDKTILSITDNGPGIAAEQAKALFDDSVVSNEKHGLGLHLIRDLAKAIQYKIAVQSEQGRGTTFTLSRMAV
jgi:signal transduction histidine kinase